MLPPSIDNKIMTFYCSFDLNRPRLLLPPLPVGELYFRYRSIIFPRIKLTKFPSLGCADIEYIRTLIKRVLTKNCNWHEPINSSNNHNPLPDSLSNYFWQHLKIHLSFIYINQTSKIFTSSMGKKLVSNRSRNILSLFAPSTSMLPLTVRVF